MSEPTVLQELLARHQVRRHKKQKAAFEAFAAARCQEHGYALRGEDHKNLLKSRNLIAGDPEKARIIYTAHYDTCAESLFPNRAYPRKRGLTLLMQLPNLLIIAGVTFAAGFLFSRFMDGRLAFFLAYLVYWLLFLFLIFGPANPRTANDNTSGVAALFQIMAALPEDLKPSAAFIFFDHEEMGRIGSKQYAKAHPGITEGKVLLNLDCVGNGEDFLVVAPKEADEGLLRLLRQAFQDEDGKRAVHCSAADTYYNSDQKSFPNGTAAQASCKDRFGYCLPRIHTRRDVICEQSNLDYVTRCAVKLAQLKSNE